jgi:hypothetical protein
MHRIDFALNPYPHLVVKLNLDTSVSDTDPDSIRSVDPYPYSESGSGSRRLKITNKNGKKLRNFMF